MIEKWATIWRASKPGDSATIIAEARRRDDLVACLAGLMRSTYPTAP